MGSIQKKTTLLKVLLEDIQASEHNTMQGRDLPSQHLGTCKLLTSLLGFGVWRHRNLGSLTFAVLSLGRGFLFQLPA